MGPSEWGGGGGGGGVKRVERQWVKGQRLSKSGSGEEFTHPCTLMITVTQLCVVPLKM